MNLDLLAKIIGYAFMAVSVGLGVVCALMFILDVIWRRVIQFKDGSVLVREFLIWKRNRNALRTSAQSADKNSDGI